MQKPSTGWPWAQLAALQLRAWTGWHPPDQLAHAIGSPDSEGAGNTYDPSRALAVYVEVRFSFALYCNS